MGSIWQPPDITPICAETQAPLTQCSHGGYMFLALLTQLFGGSIDAGRNNFGGFYNGASGFGTSGIGQTSPFGPTPIGTTPFRPIESSPSLGPVLAGSGNPGIQSHVFGKPGFKFENHFAKEAASPVFEYNFVNKGFFDFDTADSKKVEQRQSAKKKEGKKGKSRKKRQTEEYDFIIVGAGSAGCVLANRLSEVKKWKILLLEAGPEEPDVTSVPSFAPTLGRSNIDWNYRTQPEELTCRAQRGGTCPWISGKVMGGGSAINYLVYMRGNKKDYDEWAALGNDGWSYEDVLPYFKKSENNRDIEARDKVYHAVNGPLTIERFSSPDKNIIMLLNAFKETGLPHRDLNGKHQIGTMIAQTNSENGVRMSTNAAFIRPVRRRPNLFVKTDAYVTKVLIDPDTRCAYGVKYLQNGKWYESYAIKEVIISAGGLNSPKILMLSGIGPQADLEALKIPVVKHLHVGYNLQDHATTNALIMSLKNKTSTLRNLAEIKNEIIRYRNAYYKSGPLSTTGATHITAFIKTKYSTEVDNAPDIQFHFDGRNLKEFYSDPTSYLESNVLPFSFYNSMNVRPILLTPRSRGYVTLNRTHPVFGQPLIYSRFFTVKEDLDTLVEGAKFITKLENTKAFRQNCVKFVKKSVEGCSNFNWGTSDYFACLFTRYTGTIYHPTGTCKMGPRYDTDAVVDPRLKVYGIHNLRVADSSIMPNIVRGNTMAAVIMIGEKAADIIKEDWAKHF